MTNDRNIPDNDNFTEVIARTESKWSDSLFELSNYFVTLDVQIEVFYEDNFNDIYFS